jgi:hypothetical protein
MQKQPLLANRPKTGVNALEFVRFRYIDAGTTYRFNRAAALVSPEGK